MLVHGLPRQQRHRGEPKNHPHHLSLPVHRALCWWPSAKSCHKHFDGQFIFMWNAFNSLNWQEKFHKVKQQVYSSSAKQHIDKLLSWYCLDFIPCAMTSSTLAPPETAT